MENKETIRGMSRSIMVWKWDVRYLIWYWFENGFFTFESAIGDWRVDVT
jgi:hypothetical protein